MSFLNAAVLAGMAAVAIPVAIHLLNKTRIKEMRWAAMRFIEDSLKTNQRRLKIEDLLLLLARCLLVALLVLAFARPVTPGILGGVGGLGDGPVTAMVVLDVSASMGQSDGVESRISKASEEVKKIVNDLSTGSLCGLILASDTADAIEPVPTPDLGSIRRAVDRAEPTSRGSNLYPALRAAYQSLSDFADSRREIYLITDNQEVAWQQSNDIAKLVQTNPGVELKIIALGDRGEDNLAITALRMDGSVPSVDQPARVLVEVTNFSDQPQERVRVTLSVDDAAPSDEGVIPSLAPGESGGLSMFVRFENSGYHTITAAVPADRLPDDNSRSTAVLVVEQVRALIVEGERAPRLADRDAFFLYNALVPVPSSKRDEYYLNVTVDLPAKLSDPNVSDFDMIFLVNVPRVSDQVQATLREYVAGGGALVLFPGDKTQADSWADWDWLPGKWGQAVQANDESKFKVWRSRALSHPISELWNDPEAGNLGTVRTTQWLPLEPNQDKERAASEAEQRAAVEKATPDIETSAASPAADAEGVKDNAPKTIVEKTNVVFYYNSGEPAVLERPYGKGSIVMFGSSATTEWTNLPIHPAFLPLMQRLIHFSSQRLQGGLEISPGSVFVLPTQVEYVGRDFYVLRPGEEERRIAGRIAFEDGNATIRYRDTQKPGAYRISIDGQERPVAAFAVQMDATESNLELVPPAVLETLRADNSGEVGEATAPAIRQSRGKDREYWTPIMWLALILALVELGMAHRFSEAR